MAAARRGERRRPGPGARNRVRRGERALASDALGRLTLLALGGFAWTYHFLPSSLRRLLGDGLGALLRLAKLRSKVVEENLAIAFPGEEGFASRERLRKEAYGHLGNLALEILMLLGPMRRHVSRFTELRGIEHWREANREGRGAIFLSSHVGNWELMAACGGLNGIDLLMVTKHLKPEWLHQAIERGRKTCSVAGTYEPRTFRDVLAHLKKKGTVGFVLDQYAGAPIGIRVPVFGRPVGTSTVVAMLAKRTGAPVLPVVNYRQPDGRLIVEIQPRLEWLKEEDASLELAENTARYAKVLESHILAHPEQWLWIHRRFKGDLGPLRPGEWMAGRPRRG